MSGILLSLLAWALLSLYGYKHPIRGIPRSIRGGCGGDDAPQYTAPAAPTYKSASELLSSATNFGSTNYPLAYNAREGALADLAKGNSYYESFQPTSFEDALSNQYFKNVWPDTESKIKQALSLSGMAYSPVLASKLGEEYGNLATQIGTYLSDLGNTRATNSLNARLGIDPSSTYSTYLNTDINQSNTQTSSDYQNALLKAQIDYQNAMAEYEQEQAKTSSLFGLGGGTLGAIVLGPWRFLQVAYL